ncbi:MAG: phosphatidylglycerophosphatase A, partial [Planctomycetes bacterium]|nr:phosphatidylglycerophosphatase A [Planctomycetota bacterium]
LWTVNGGIPLNFPLRGTAGTIQALLVYLVIWHFAGQPPSDVIIAGLAVFFTVLSFVLEPWAKRYARSIGHNKPDDPAFFVIDEFAGFFVTISFLPKHQLVWLTLLGAFVCFRLFDVVKPFPIRRLEHLRGGIVWDDVLAGIYANILLQIGLKILTS